MVKLRFGAYGASGEPLMSVRHIGIRLGIPKDRVYYWLRKYLAEGCTIKRNPYWGLQRTKPKLTEEQ